MKESSLLEGHASDHLEPIVFNVPATYGEKVKVHDWQMQRLAEPRDNTEIFPPKGHLHLASYKRLGPHTDPMWTTETQSMMAQIELKQQYQPLYAKRSMLNMHTFAMMEQCEEEKELHFPEILLDPDDAKNMDYRTTAEVDFRLPYPIKPKPPPPPPPPEPWLMNRRTFGWSLRELERRPGQNTFLDDNMDLHLRIAQLKAERTKTNELLLNIDPTKCSDNVPTKAVQGSQGTREYERDRVGALCLAGE